MAASSATLQDDYIHAFASRIVFSYPTITLTTLQFINCRTVGPWRLVATSPDTLCTTTEYYAWSVLYYVLLAVVVIGFPLVMALLLYRWRTRLQTKIYKDRYGALYLCYRDRSYWYVHFVCLSVVVSFIDGSVAGGG